MEQIILKSTHQKAPNRRYSRVADDQPTRTRPPTGKRPMPAADGPVDEIKGQTKTMSPEEMAKIGEWQPPDAEKA